MDLIQQLSDLGIEFCITRFPKRAFTSREVAEALNIAVGRVAKTLLLTVSDGSYILAVVPGDRRLNLHAFSTILGNRQVSLTSRSDVTSITGLVVGALTPLVALTKPEIQIFFDRDLMSEDTINVSSGDLLVGIMLKPEDLIRVVGANIASIGE